jgi:hypothetical protein
VERWTFGSLAICWAALPHPQSIKEKDMSKRAVIRLQLDIPAKQQLDKLCDKRGMTQIAVLSRLVKWFGRQDEVVQASVLGLLSDETLGELSAVIADRSSREAISGAKE